MVNQPCATHSGWILRNEIIGSTKQPNRKACHLITANQLHDQLKRFWNQEEIAETPIYTKQEQMCEKLFCETVKREADGRFIVRLPKKPEVALGHSRKLALKRLHSLERHLKKQSEAAIQRL